MEREEVINSVKERVDKTLVKQIEELQKLLQVYRQEVWNQYNSKDNTKVIINFKKIVEADDEYDSICRKGLNPYHPR